MREREKESMGDSKFLCSNYDDRVDLEANETNSWERDHRCKNRKINAWRYIGGGSWTSDI